MLYCEIAFQGSDGERTELSKVLDGFLAQGVTYRFLAADAGNASVVRVSGLADYSADEADRNLYHTTYDLVLVQLGEKTKRKVMPKTLEYAKALVEPRGDRK
jgi:hypothetical protein